MVSGFASLNLVKSESLIPGTNDQKVVRGIELLGTKLNTPDGLSSFAESHNLSFVLGNLLSPVDCQYILSSLVSDEDITIEKTDGKELTIWRPVAAQAARFKLGLSDCGAI